MHTNALSESTSPYLKQHQHNPVDWVPWGKEAWQRAREEDKLVIVSVGYSACHWCHVMEHETFENEEAAAFMNAHFLCIKVDREERPDVDQVYMDAVQLMTRRGGWPLNCVALPDGRPIWGGTYFPKAQWLAGLNAVLEVWKEDPEKVEAYAAQLVEAVGAMDDASQDGPAGETLVDIAGSEGDAVQQQVDAHLAEGLSRWRGTWDPEYGGGRGAPKFPLPCQIECCLRLADAGRTPEGAPRSGPLGWTPEWRDALGDHAMLTLRAMARGGIHDHVGGGFSRYSVDERWHVPHFEKMLYDNGQLLGAYAEAWRRAPHPALMQAAEGIVDFLTRELDDPSGGFRSALDADSDGAEGTYYVWRTADLKAALPDEEARKEVFDVFDVNGRSFWEQGQNVLMRPANQDDALWADEARQRRMAEALKRMSDWRDSPASGRTKPGLDDKVLTAWTALAVTGLAKAGRLMQRPEWVARAERGGAFLRNVATLPGESHVLRRSWHADGGPEVEGFAEDYALTIEAMIELHQSTLDDHWLREARAWMAVTMDRFFDEKADTFWFTSREGESLFAAKQSTDDSVMPSANATLASCLWALGWACDIPVWRDMARRLTARHLLGTPHLERTARWIRAWVDMSMPWGQIVVAAPSRELAKAQLDGWWGEARPGTMVRGVWPESSHIPTWMEGKRPASDDPVRWYVCVEGACGMPSASADEAWTQFTALSP